MYFIIFFTYGDNIKGTSIVLADSRDNAKEKFLHRAKEDEYTNVYIWWSEELDKMITENSDVIIS